MRRNAQGAVALSSMAARGARTTDNEWSFDKGSGLASGLAAPNFFLKIRYGSIHRTVPDFHERRESTSSLRERIQMTKIVKLFFGLAMLAISQMAMSNEASAQRRCGDFIQNGTIYVASRARDCNRGTAWVRDSRGQRHWGTSRMYGSSHRSYYHGRRAHARSYAPAYAYRPAAVVAVTTNYIPGAPRNVAECIARGGAVANGGRGCAGYR